MKTLYLIRHAKSSWSNPMVDDFDRELNERGLRDAPFMAELLKKNGVEPDFMVVSAARRTRLTAAFFAEILKISSENTVFEPLVYEARAEKVLEIIRNLENRHEIVLLFGHNPAMTDLANHFSKKFIDNVPTCGIVKIEAAIENWSDFLPKNASVTGTFFPSMFLPGIHD